MSGEAKKHERQHRKIRAAIRFDTNEPSLVRTSHIYADSTQPRTPASRLPQVSGKTRKRHAPTVVGTDPRRATNLYSDPRPSTAVKKSRFHACSPKSDVCTHGVLPLRQARTPIVPIEETTSHIRSLLALLISSLQRSTTMHHHLHYLAYHLFLSSALRIVQNQSS